MSANNQILVKEYNGKWYVFDDVMAETWCDDAETDCDKHTHNSINIKNGISFDTHDEAIIFAYNMSLTDYIEYGVIEDVTCKDGATVNIIE